MDDHALLQEYLAHHSETAFAELVERYLPLVYGTALRLAGDAHTAQDIAQAVFIQLARKAWTIRNGHALPGWLYRATHHAAYAARRGEIRRRERETVAMNLADQNQPSAGIADQIAPLLDEALASLSRVEQDAVLLRYFQDKSFREVGATLGLHEDAARKRTDRALDKIRLHFSRRGITATAALLGSAITAHAATPPPIGFAAKVAGNSFAQAAAATGLIQTALTAFFMSTTTKIITAVAVVALIASLSLGLHYHQSSASLNQPLGPSVNGTPVSSAQRNPKLAFVPAPIEQVVAPKLTPVPASNVPDAYGVTLDKKVITNNLRQLATAASQYMLDKGMTEARYSDLVGTKTDNYIRTIAPVDHENYDDFILYQTQTQVTQVAPDGSIVTYNL